MIAPLPNEPMLATKLWRETVAAAGLRCQCSGQCGGRHKPDRLDEFPDRCKESLVFGGTQQPKPGARLLVREVQPGRHAAVCPGCFAGLDRIDNRAKRQRAAGPPQEETLF